MIDFNKTVGMNVIKNFSVTISNKEITEEILGNYIGALEVKTVCKLPTQVKIGFVEVPKWLIKIHKKMLIEVDVMFI